MVNGYFTPIFVGLKLTYLVILFDHQLQFSQNSHKLEIFDKLLSTQNLNVARFSRNVKLDFFQ